MIRRLLHFVALALVVLGLRAALAPRPVLYVTVPPGGSEAAAVEEALLLAEAEKFGWIETDPVILRHLAKGYRDATGTEETDFATLLAGAYAIGLHRTDRVVRSRLVDRGRRALREGPEPDEAALRDHLAAHPERFRTAALYTLTLRHPDPASAKRLPLTVRPTFTATASRLATRFGRDFAASVREAAEGAEVGGPPGVPEGWRTVVTEVRPGRVPELAEVRAAVRDDWHRARAGEREARRWATLKRKWRIEVDHR